MNRRGFLTGLLASAAVPALPLADSLSIGESPEYLTLADWVGRMSPSRIDDITELVRAWAGIDELFDGISWKPIEFRIALPRATFRTFSESMDARSSEDQKRFGRAMLDIYSGIES